MIEIKYNDTVAQALLQRIVDKTSNAEPVLRAIGETVMEISKQSFETSSSPDGSPWAKNSDVTILRYLEQQSGNFKGDGNLSKKGQARQASKKPLIGQSKDLSRQFSYEVTADSVTVSNSMVYAAIQQFGGTRSQFPHLWGDIPARPFMPIDGTGKLMPLAEAEIVGLMQEYLDEIIEE
ncbi:phage virion morphogenesis protein [Undibacterium sp. TJN19]|uniref:phage virion morphogenesis protein n=1 Tax=Undibacterium sp. TJN19 TaxID=3413055 RepID=UPI003BF20116